MTTICPKCKGMGFIFVPTSKYVIKPEIDPWDYSGLFDGRSYHTKICKRCNGTGEIDG